MDELIDRALAEDVGDGDLTTRILVPPDARASAHIEQREPGVIAGLEVAAAVFARFDVRLEPAKDVVARLEGPAAGILTAERTALNFLGRLSGIATLTARYVEAVDGTGVQILDTRKTTPGLRELEKAAVAAGGGTNHRMGLYDAVMVKENHAAVAGGLASAARKAVAEAPEGVEVCVECETPEDVDIAIDDADLRIDTYRASGAGGQHVNKTDSAVRITHVPTGIVVQCQNERSQLSNRQTAMRILKSRLAEHEEEKREAELAKERGVVLDTGFGSQIRSYVLHPYQLVKDHRTDVEEGNTQGVLGGDLDRFIHAYLLAKAAGTIA